MLENNPNRPSLFRLVDFASFDSWDVKTYFAKKLEAHFPYISLSECIIEQNNKIKPFDFPEDDFEILGVDNKNGIFDAYVEKGKNIKQQYKVVEDNFVAYNPYRINVGSIGLKDSNHKHKYISPAYVVFSCKDNLLAKYLYILFKTPTFNKVIRDATTGSVRQNLSFDNLSEMQIPLPPIDDQKIIISNYGLMIKQAEQLHKEAEFLSDKIEQTLFKELGIDINTNEEFEKGKLYLVDFKNLKQWGVSVNNLGLTAETIFLSKKYQNKSIHEFFQINPTTKPPQDIDISFIPMASVSEVYGQITKYESKKIEKGYTKFKENDIIWARITPCMENGKSAIAKNLKNGYGFGSTEFHVLRSKNDNFNLELLSMLLRTKLLRETAMTYFTGSAGQQRVPKEFLESLTLPYIENQDEQKRVIQKVRDLQIQQKNCLEQAEQFKAKAINDFERAIFA